VKRVAAIVLAAGFSRRFGAANKLLATLREKPAIAHVLKRVASTPFSGRFVVVNPDGADIAALCDPRRFVLVENKDAAAGIGRSIAAGVKRAGNADAALIILGDMPLVARETYSAILDAFSKNPNKLIIAPEYEGRRGHPVLFARSLFAALMALNGDAGAKSVIEQNTRSQLLVPVIDPGVLRDFDTASDVKRFNSLED